MLNVIEPTTWNEYIGQKESVRLARITAAACMIEQRPLPNVLICGGYGLGKSSLARLILNRVGRPTTLTDAAILNVAPPTEGELAVDEIHRLKPEISDSFNVAMDSGKMHILGATTNPGALTPAFRSRFRIIYLQPYKVNEIATILGQICARKKLPMDRVAVNALARRSRLNPRQAINYLLTLLDISTVTNKGVINKEFIERELTKMGITSEGYTYQDKTYLAALPNRPVGVSYLASKLGVDKETIESEIEPFLLSTGVIDRTPQGRIKLREIQ